MLRKNTLLLGPFSRRITFSLISSPAKPAKPERVSIGALEMRFTTRMSRPISESLISKYHLSSTLCTENKPLRVWALSVITSLKGFGPGLAAAGGVPCWGGAPAGAPLPPGAVGRCCAIAPEAMSTTATGNSSCLVTLENVLMKKYILVPQGKEIHFE